MYFRQARELFRSARGLSHADHEFIAADTRRAAHRGEHDGTPGGKEREDGTTTPVVDGCSRRGRHDGLRGRPRAQDPEAHAQIQAGPRRRTADPAPSLKRFELLRDSKSRCYSLRRPGDPETLGRLSYGMWITPRFPHSFSRLIHRNSTV